MTYLIEVTSGSPCCGHKPQTPAASRCLHVCPFAACVRSAGISNSWWPRWQRRSPGTQRPGQKLKRSAPWCLQSAAVEEAGRHRRSNQNRKTTIDSYIKCREKVVGNWVYSDKVEEIAPSYKIMSLLWFSAGWQKIERVESHTR